MYMHIEGSPIVEGICDLEDVLEELEDIIPLTEADDPVKFSYLGLQDEKTGYVLLISRIDENRWAMVFGDTEKETDFDTVVKTVKEFFDGKLPKWSPEREKEWFICPGDLPEFVERGG